MRIPALALDQRAMKVWIASETRTSAHLTQAWPFVMLFTCALAATNFVRLRVRFEPLLPFVCAGVAHASFLSQGLGGSSYGIS